MPDAAREGIFDSADGFSMIELIVATGILATAVLSLVGVLTVTAQRAVGSTPALIAREKAREAIESVHTARDTGALSWALVQNVDDGGAFLEGARALRTPGDDGLINTADDGAIEKTRTPGADGILGNEDDVETELSEAQYSREIAITPLTQNGSQAINQNLRQVTVTVRYRVQGQWRNYILTTYVSAFS
jgi:type II secretory pathway pseudopilin PulG